MSNTVETGRSELVGQKEIAQRLRVSPEWIRRLTAGGAFPEPLGHLGNRPVWAWAPVRAWALREGRLGVIPAAGSIYTHKGSPRAECDACGCSIEPRPGSQGNFWWHRIPAEARACPAVTS